MSSSVKHVLMNYFKTFSNLKYVRNLNSSSCQQKKAYFDCFVGVSKLHSTAIMTDISIKTEKTPTEIKTDFDTSGSVNKSVMGSHEQTPAADIDARSSTDLILPVKKEQLLTSEHLDKLNVKKEDSQEEKAKIIKTEVFNIFLIIYIISIQLSHIHSQKCLVLRETWSSNQFLL